MLDIHQQNMSLNSIRDIVSRLATCDRRIALFIHVKYLLVLLFRIGQVVRKWLGTALEDSYVFLQEPLLS
jgi:hypothetical protein